MLEGALEFVAEAAEICTRGQQNAQLAALLSLNLNEQTNKDKRFAVASARLKTGQASPLWSSDLHLPLVAFRRFQQRRVFAVAVGAGHGLVAVTVVAVRFGPTAAGSAALHLHIFLRGRAGAGAIAVVEGRRRGILPAAVAALRLEAQVGPALAEAAHPVQLCHGAAAGRSPRQGAARGRRHAP